MDLEQALNEIHTRARQPDIEASDLSALMRAKDLSINRFLEINTKGWLDLLSDTKVGNPQIIQQVTETRRYLQRLLQHPLTVNGQLPQLINLPAPTLSSLPLLPPAIEDTFLGFVAAVQADHSTNFFAALPRLTRLWEDEGFPPTEAATLASLVCLQADDEAAFDRYSDTELPPWLQATNRFSLGITKMTEETVRQFLNVLSEVELSHTPSLL